MRNGFKKNRTNGILLFVLLVFFINSNQVQADVAPPEPPSGSNPLPEDEVTNVRMVAETVIISIDADTPHDKGIATVEATFTMQNLGSIDESMDVRFPLDQTIGWGNLCKDPAPQFPSITDLRVEVNGQFIETYKTYETIILPTITQPQPTITIPCWENFHVNFPVGEDVIIKVIYSTMPYEFPDASFKYSYILETGSGWKDTIGSADIVFQFPYDINVENFYRCLPKECVLEKNKVKWQFKNFEPFSNINISVMPPPLWQRILVEKENISQDLNDGEAWGRLAKAYKEANMQRRGFRSLEMFMLSKEAYEKATSLLPNDADWHYGFAELLCWNAEWNNFLINSDIGAWQECAEELKLAITINPSHQEANELLQYLGQISMVELTNPQQPNFLILTAQPVTFTPSPIQVLTTNTDIPFTPTMIPTKQNQENPIVENPTALQSNKKIVLVSFILLVFILGIVIYFRKNNKNSN